MAKHENSANRRPLLSSFDQACANGSLTTPMIAVAAAPAQLIDAWLGSEKKSFCSFAAMLRL